MSRGVIEANGSARDCRRRAASAMPQNLVTIAHLLAWKIEEPRRSHTVFARQAVTGALRHERELARAQHLVFASLYFQQTLTKRHDVEHQTVVECRQCERPWRREFRPAVHDTGHPEEMQSFTQRINRCQWNLHESSMARLSCSSTILDERAAIRDSRALSHRAVSIQSGALPKGDSQNDPCDRCKRSGRFRGHS